MPLPHAGAGTHTYRWGRILSLPALKALGTACLPFTVTAVCVCAIVCVCRSEEGDIACQVLSRAKLSFLSVITPSYFPGAGCLSLCLSITHTHTLSQTGGAPDSVSPVRRAVREERGDWSKLTSWWADTHCFRLENQSCSGPVQTRSAARPFWPDTTTQSTSSTLKPLIS